MDTKETSDEIFPLLQRQSNTAFPEFGFKKVARGWVATAGEINGVKAKDHLYHYDNTPFCLVNQKTGESISLWKYIQSRGRTNKENL